MKSLENKTLLPLIKSFNLMVTPRIALEQFLIVQESEYLYGFLSAQLLYWFIAYVL